MKYIRSFSKFIVACIMAFGFVYPVAAQPRYTLSSPDKELTVDFFWTENGSLSYTFDAGKCRLIDDSSLGFQTQSGEVIPSSSSWGIENSIRRKVNTNWKPVWGKRNNVADCFNELILNLAAKSTPTSLSQIQLIARVYNDGLAFRFVVPPTETVKVPLSAEITRYNFAGNYTAWFYNGENHNIGPEKLSDSQGKRLPVMTLQADKNQYLAVHEADLASGPPMVLESKKGETQMSITTHPAHLFPGYTSAWRVILFGSTPGQLVDSHIIELLNPDPAADMDFSWVKPGISVWDWRMDGAITEDGFKYTMSYPSWTRMVDFAAKQGFNSLVLDANWYGPEHEAQSNPLTGDKANDVKRIIQYGKERGIGVWLYLNDVGGRKYPIEKTLTQYGEWGAAGVKYGFMNGSPEEKNAWTRKITALCAQNKLLVDYHDGPVHPYGQMRTWPNALTREYCHAQLDAHRVFAPKTFVTTVFVNMIAGPIDMNNGMFDLRQGHTTRVDESQPVPSTLVSEAARTLIVFSGATILPDIPEYYRKYPALLDFISAQKMPWKESRTLSGEIGEYIVMMRQTEDAWLVAAATNELARSLEIPLDFLPKGQYKVQKVEDASDGHYLTNRETLSVETISVSRNDKIKVNLAPGGGACLTFTRK